MGHNSSEIQSLLLKSLQVCPNTFGRNGFQKPSGNFGLAPLIGCFMFNGPSRQNLRKLGSKRSSFVITLRQVTKFTEN